MNDEEKSREQLIRELEELRREIAEIKAKRSCPLRDEFLPRIVNQIKTPIFAKDEEHRWVFLNDAACQVTGYPKEYVLGKSDHDLLPGEWADLLREKEVHVLRTGETNISDEEIIRDGKVRTISTLKDRWVDPETGKKLIVGLIQDISERKQAEQKLHDALNFLQVLMDTIPAPIFYMDGAGLYLGCNKAFETCLGLTREKIVGKPVVDVTPAPLAGKYHEMDSGFFHEPGVQLYEASVVYADGMEHDVVFYKSTFANGQDGVAGIVGVMLDVTERNRTEERFRQMVELSPHPISIIDPDGRYLYLNRKFIEVFGYTLEDIPNGKAWFRKALPDKAIRRRARSFWISCLESFGRSEVRSREFSVRCKDGSIREVLFRPAMMECGMHFITYEDLTELKKAHQTLRESEERYRLIFDHSPLGVMHFDANGVIVDCNSRFVQILGSSKETLIGFPMLERLRDEAMRSAVVDGLEGRLGTYEGDYLSVTGNKLTSVRALYSRITAKDGEILGASCIFEDISERKRAEARLRESEARYRAIVEDQTELISRFSPDGSLTFANEAYCRYFGELPHELIGNRFWHHVPDEDREKLMAHIAGLNHEHPVDMVEHRVITKKGEIRWQQWTDRAILNERGEVLEIQAVGRDITRRRQAEEELRASEERLRILFECAPDAYYLNDLQGNFADGNRAAEEISGYKREELIGKSFLELKLLSSEQIPEAVRQLARSALGHPTGPEECTIKRKDGKAVVLEIRTFPTRIGGRTLVLGIARDITERKRVKEALRESKRRLQALSSKLLSAQEEERRRIAVELHDGISASLSAILIYADNARRKTQMDGALPESLERVVAIAKNTIEEIRRIITDLRPSILDDFGIIKTAQWFCNEFKAIHPGIDTETRISLCENDVPEPLKIAIFRIMQEAFHNISKYSKADRAVLSLAKKGITIELVIEDNGAGFDLNSALTEKRDKGGIGLSSMRERAELTGGSFLIESTKRKGTILCARWPCES